MSGWFKSFGTLHHGFGGRFKLGSLAPAEEFDEAVTKGQLSEFDGPISTVSSLSATTLSSTTLNVDFTDTLDFVMETGASLYFGENYFGPMAGWVPLNTTGDIIAQKLENSDILIHNGVFDLEFDPGFGPLPVVAAGQVLEVITGSYSGSVFTNSVVKNPNGYGSTEMALRAKEGADNRQYAFETIADLANGGNDGLSIRKINETGEDINLFTTDLQTGFVLANTLSDASASLFKFLDNSDDTLFEVRNDGLFVGPNIPTADPLEFGQIWLDGDTLKVSAGAP